MNTRPKEGDNSSVLFLLLLVIAIGGLLYIGWEYLADKPGPIPTSARTESSTEPVETPANTEEQNKNDVAVVDLQPSGEVIPSEKNKEATEESKPEKKEEKKKEEVKKIENEDITSATPKSGSSTSYSHKVDIDETLYSIAKRYNMSIDALKKMNPDLNENDIKVGSTKLKVKIQTTHTVGAGDVLRVVAEKYGISKEALMRANGKTKDYAARGEKLVIPLQ